MDPYSVGGFLPVFGFLLEAGTFLWPLGDEEKEMGGRSTETTGELISMLLAPCANVKWVALDPLPLSFGRATLPFVSINRERFVQELMEERKESAGELVST